MSRLLIITQKVDKNDENLGAFYYWFEEFAKRFEKVEIIASFVGEENLPDNVNVYSLGKEKGYGKARRILNFFLIFYGNYFKSDVVFFHMIPEFVIASSPFFLFLRPPSLKASAWRSRKIVLWYAHKSVTWKLKFAARIVDYIFSSSEAGFRIPSKKVIFTGQAINTDIFYPSSEINSAKLYFISIGRIASVKKLDVTIQALVNLEKSWPREWSFSIIGGPILKDDYKYLNFLKELVKKEGLEKKVNFFGPKPYSEVPSLMREHDFLVNLSETGSLDKVVLEAMASGLTVLTSTEGYKNVLPERYFLENIDPGHIAERIKLLADERRPNLNLRDIVLKNHSLKTTIDKITQIILK